MPLSAAGGSHICSLVRPETLHSTTSEPLASNTCKVCGSEPTPGPGSTSNSIAGLVAGTRSWTSASFSIQRYGSRESHQSTGNQPLPKWIPDSGRAMSCFAFPRKPSSVKGKIPSRANIRISWLRQYASCSSKVSSTGISLATSYLSVRYMRPLSSRPDARNRTSSSGNTISILVDRMNSPRARRIPTFLAIIWYKGSAAACR